MPQLTFIAVDYRVSVQTNNHKVSLLADLLKKVHVANMEQVEGTSHISRNGIHSEIIQSTVRKYLWL